jgi:hypothetical protein
MASFADLATGGLTTEAVLPAMLHREPRFSRRRYGSGWSRLGYAIGQIFFTHRDSGKADANFSEIAGNPAAVVIAQSCDPGNRKTTDAAAKLMMQMGTDMTGNALKAFWPDTAPSRRASAGNSRALQTLHLGHCVFAGT